ncbi:MAG: hypothetical protein O3C22_05265 [Bacteroidetes bacterium]|nr:hypothetical protein [Bacteroidota bacterium]MDA0943643.1 hypothetical protein [Bacteroidota bacterium]MDA1111576.1 hypothetical protein [Bacteroidota bacterium]
MKYAAFVLLVGLAFVACEKEEGLLSKKEKKGTGIPVVEWVDTLNTDSLYYKKAFAQAVVVADSGLPVSERGFVISTSEAPSIDDPKTQCGQGLGVFQAFVKNLDYGQTYHLRAYAINELGVGYSEELSFESYKLDLPTVTAKSTVANIKIDATAEVSGEVVSSNGGTVTERGVVWSSSPNPTINDNKKSNGSGLGKFSVVLTGLQYSTKYYYRAYAINEAGTAYSDEYSFDSYALQLASVSVGSAPTVISQGGAQITGNVTSANGGTVSDRGIVWSTSPNPTTNNKKASSGSGVGSFNATLSGLSINTKYYYRAYATNEAGTAYSSEYSFNSKTVNLPSVSVNSSPNSVGSGTAQISGNATSANGGTISERGIVWSTSPNPTTSNNKVSSGSGTGTFAGNLSGLSNFTKYYYRAYAINEAGTAYSSEYSFNSYEPPCTINQGTTGSTYSIQITSKSSFQPGESIKVTMYSSIYSFGQASSVKLYNGDNLVYTFGSWLVFDSNNSRQFSLPSSLATSNCYNIRVYKGSDVYVSPKFTVKP